MKKRGQLTIFIIISLIIVFGILIYFIFPTLKSNSYNNDFLNGKNLDQKSQTIRTNIFDCIEKTSKQALITIAVQGGYYKEPKYYYKLENGFFPYYYYKGEIFMPSIETIQNSIKEYTEDNLNECLNSKEYPLPTKFSKPNIKITIKEKEVIFNVDSKITITDYKTTKIVELKDKNFHQESYIKGMIDIARYLTEQNKQDPKYFCINCLGQLAKEKGVDVDIYPFFENHTTHVIIHENKTNNPDLFMFTFLNKYTGSEKSPQFD